MGLVAPGEVPVAAGAEAAGWFAVGVGGVHSECGAGAPASTAGGGGTFSGLVAGRSCSPHAPNAPHARERRITSEEAEEARVTTLRMGRVVSNADAIFEYRATLRALHPSRHKRELFRHARLPMRSRAERFARADGHSVCSHFVL